MAKKTQANKNKKPSTAAAKRNKPKRPLSAYNYFFKDERERIIKSSRQDVSFAEIGRRIGRNWKVIDAKRLAKYNQLAAQDMRRYKNEMELFDQIEETKLLENETKTLTAALTRQETLLRTQALYRSSPLSSTTSRPASTTSSFADRGFAGPSSMTFGSSAAAGYQGLYGRSVHEGEATLVPPIYVTPSPPPVAASTLVRQPMPVYATRPYEYSYSFGTPSPRSSQALENPPLRGSHYYYAEAWEGHM